MELSKQFDLRGWKLTGIVCTIISEAAHETNSPRNVMTLYLLIVY